MKKMILILFMSLLFSCGNNHREYESAIRFKRTDFVVTLSAAAWEEENRWRFRFFKAGEKLGLFTVYKDNRRDGIERAILAFVKEDLRDKYDFRLHGGNSPFFSVKIGERSFLGIRSVSEKTAFGFGGEAVVVDYEFEFVPNEIGQLMLEFNIGRLPPRGKSIEEVRLIRGKDSEHWQIYN